MDLLIDTHAVIWFITADSKLPLKTKKIIENSENTGFELLPITINQILINSGLENHHHDPFDRMIIAQAICENLKIVTKDDYFKNYSVSLIWNK